MMSHITLFDTEEELIALTGLTHKQLWDAGFNLDDWNWGFRTINEILTNAEASLIDIMESCYCSVEMAYYNGYYYYLAYHA